MADGLGRLFLQGVPRVAGEPQQSVKCTLVAKLSQGIDRALTQVQVAHEVEAREQDVQALSPPPLASASAARNWVIGS